MHNLQLLRLSHLMTEMERWLTPGLSVVQPVQVRRTSFLLLFVSSGCFLASNVDEVRHVVLVTFPIPFLHQQCSMVLTNTVAFKHAFE